METTALGKKLFLSLFVFVRIALYRLPDGNRSNRQCPGCVVSLLMLEAFFFNRLVWTLSRLGRSVPIIRPATLTTRCRSFLSETVQLEYHTIMQ